MRTPPRSGEWMHKSIQPSICKNVMPPDCAYYGDDFLLLNGCTACKSMTGFISLDSCLAETAANLKRHGLCAALSQALPELAELSLRPETKPSLLTVYNLLKGRALLVQGARVWDYSETLLIGTWVMAFRAVQTVGPNSCIYSWYTGRVICFCFPWWITKKCSIAIML